MNPDALKELSTKSEQTKALEEMVQSLTEQKVQQTTDLDSLKKKLATADKENLDLKRNLENVDTELEGKER